MNNSITQSQLKSILIYDPLSGIFTRRVSLGNQKPGTVCGTNKSGYLVTSINNKRYYLHRLAFLYMDGYLPENDVDHINRIKNDNRWSNLREVSRTCNMVNKSIMKNNISGITGVSWDVGRNRWCASIKPKNMKKINLGVFKSKTDAVLNRYLAEVKYNFYECISDSTAYNYIKNVFSEIEKASIMMP